MDIKSSLPVILAILTVVFASFTLAEYSQANTLVSELSTTKSTRTLTSTTTVTSTTPCPSFTACGTFTYSPTGELRVDSVQAVMYGQGAQLYGRHVVFAVTVEDVGNSSFYFESWALNSSIAAGSQ
jgi:hypothetical protein